MPLQIRQLERSEWPLLREVRIAALEDAPREFGETLAEVRARSEQAWCALAPSAHMAELDGRCVGIVFAFEDAADRDAARLGGMWVAPDTRRAGVGLRLVQAVVGWATMMNKQRTGLWVNPETPAEALYRRARFVPTGASRPFPGDASRSVIEMLYSQA